MSGRGRGGLGLGGGSSELERIKNEVRTVGGSFSSKNIVGSRLRPRPPKKQRMRVQDFALKIKKPRTLKEPKPLKIRKGMTPEQLKKVAEKNRTRVEKYKDRVQRQTRIELNKDLRAAKRLKKEEEAKQKQLALQDKKNSIIASLNLARANVITAIGDGLVKENGECAVIPMVKQACKLKRKVDDLTRKAPRRKRMPSQGPVQIKRQRRVISD